MGSLDLRHRIALEIDRVGQQRLIKEHPLQHLFWECTLRCNLHCRHCGSDCKQVASVKDMPLEDFLKVLDSVRKETDPHKITVILTGGEPLVRPDIVKCVEAIYAKGFPVGMVSNGLAVTREKLKALFAAGLGSATVSLDGLEEDHDWMRQVKGSFRKASEAIYLFAHAGIPFDVVTCVNKRNYHKLDEIKRHIYSLGVKSWRLFSIFPVGRAAEDPELQLSNEEYTGMLRYIRECRRNGEDVSYGCEGFLGNFEGEVRSHFFSCQAGVTVGSVLCDGSISSCPSIRADYHQGNIYKDDFMEVWNSSFAPYRDREWMRTGECADCQYFRYCRGNGMHLRDSEGKLILCHLKRLV